MLFEIGDCEERLLGYSFGGTDCEYSVYPMKYISELKIYILHICYI